MDDQKSARRVGATAASEQPRADDAQSIAYLSCEPAKTALHGIIDKSGWQRTDRGGYAYGDLKRTYVAMADPRSSSTALEQASMLPRLLQFDDSTAQTFLFVMARTLASNVGERQLQRVHVNELLEFKGFKRDRSGDFRSYAKRDEGRRLKQLSEIWVSIDDEVRVKAGSRLRKKRVTAISRLIEIVVELEKGRIRVRDGDDLELLSAPETEVPYSFKVGLGNWSTIYTEPTLLHTVFAAIGKYDATQVTQRYAMLIAFSLMFRSDRLRARWRLRELLNEARIELPTHHADRFRQYVEDAFDRLRRDGLISLWEFVDAKEEDLPGKRWLERWLDWEVRIVTATDESSAIAPTIEPRARARASKKRAPAIDESSLPAAAKRG